MHERDVQGVTPDMCGVVVGPFRDVQTFELVTMNQIDKYLLCRFSLGVDFALC